MANEHNYSIRPHLSQYHCTTLRTLAPSDMCTSLAPGFYLRDKEKFLNWKDMIYRLKKAYKDECIFSVFDKTPSFMRELSDHSGGSNDSFSMINMMPKNTMPSTKKSNNKIS
jgi:hypothetical protein